MMSFQIGVSGRIADTDIAKVRSTFEQLVRDLRALDKDVNGSFGLNGVAADVDAPAAEAAPAAPIRTSRETTGAPGGLG